MKSRVFIPLTLLFSLLFTSACTSKRLQKEQVELHKQVLEGMDKVLTRVEYEINTTAKLVLAAYNPKEKCSSKWPKEQNSSFYLPASVRRGNHLNCIQKVSAQIEKPFKKFYESTDYLSWLYLYDSDSRALRLLPATSAQTLFGKDLVFDSFMFYELATKSYPKGVWVPIKFDVNGTGRIMIYSQAIKLPGTKNYTTLAADTQPEGLFRENRQHLISFATKNNVTHLFAYGYQIEDDRTIPAYDFSTNPSKWNILRTFSGVTVNTRPEEAPQLETLQKEAVEANGGVIGKVIQLDGVNHFCTQAMVPRVRLSTVICSEKSF